jgi:hypothetical protein
MYALIIVIGPTVGVTSQIVGKYRNPEECKAVASQPHAGGPISDFDLSANFGGYWFCTYTGAN